MFIRTIGAAALLFAGALNSANAESDTSAMLEIAEKEAPFRVAEACSQTYRDMFNQKDLISQPTMGRCDLGFAEYLLQEEYETKYVKQFFGGATQSNVSFRLIHGVKGTVGYIQAKTSFNNKTGYAMMDALRTMKEDTNDVIIDTRHNKGGSIVPFLQLAVGFAQFEDDIVYTEHNPKKDDVVWTAAAIVARLKAAQHEAARIGEFADMNVTWLVNGASVSAAEDLPAATRELSKNVFVVGSKTYGKGTKQELFELPSGNHFRITTAFLLFGEKQRKLNRKGVRLHKEISDTRKVWGDTTDFERDAQFRFAFQRYAGEPADVDVVVASN